LHSTLVIATAAKQSHLFSRAAWVLRWCDCFAALAMTSAFLTTEIRAAFPLYVL
jgi:hypothetical protein